MSLEFAADGGDFPNGRKVCLGSCCRHCRPPESGSKGPIGAVFDCIWTHPPVGRPVPAARNGFGRSSATSRNISWNVSEG
jgi:hypothetical protein